MRVKAKHSHGQIALEITAENANDRALLGLFDAMNNKSGNPQRHIACGSAYSCDVGAVTSLHLSGLDMKPAPQEPQPSSSDNKPISRKTLKRATWNSAIEAAARCAAEYTGDRKVEDILKVLKR